MISISKLLYGTSMYGDTLRYNKDSRRVKDGATNSLGPVVVWNSTIACNLRCIHCYSDACTKPQGGELTTNEAKKLIEDLGHFNVPVLLFSGGEPLLRDDIIELSNYCHKFNIRPTLSTNGTLITKEVAKSIKQANIGYVGISIDGIGEDNDKFRGHSRAYELAINGIRNCIEVGQRVGLRFTINRYNYKSLKDIFNLVKEENIDRVCFYHLVYTGRGSTMMDEDISHEETRNVMDIIIEETQNLYSKGIPKEILTVDNHADGIYLYLKMKKENPELAQRIYSLLTINGGNRTGMAFGAIDSLGYVHPDQFSHNHIFGNVRERSFGEIWTDTSNPILAGLKNRKTILKGRCSACKWLSQCNGNFRARAEAAYKDYWESDPACYLSDNEIDVQP